MRTVAQFEAFVQSQFSDSSTKTQTQIRHLTNLGSAEMRMETPWKFDLKSFAITSVADQASYELPVDLTKFASILITAGGTEYSPKFIASREDWDLLITNSSYTSDIPQYVTEIEGKLHIYPTPATSGNTFALDYYGAPGDYVADDFTDYETGTCSFTNGSTAVTGSGTVFAASMIGDHIRGGDGQWYKIESVGSSSAITLAQAYQGLSASGVTTMIGKLFPWGQKHPEGSNLLYNFVMQHLYERREEFSGSGGRAVRFENKWIAGIKKWRKRIKNMYDGAEVTYIDDGMLRNPNDHPTNLTS